MRKLLILVILAVALPRTALRAADVQTPSATAPATGPALPAESMTVRRFVIDGNTAFSNAKLESLLAAYVGQPLTFELLDDARRKITDFYVANGYVTSGAVLPVQDIVAGVVWIHVVEGKLERLDISGNQALQREYFADRLQRSLREPLRVTSIQDALEVLQQDPLLASVEGRLIPGSALGYAVLDLKVQEARPYQVGIQVDNAGTPATGAERVALVGSDLNLTGIGDSIVGRFGPISGGFEHPEFAPANDISVEYRRPIIGDQTSLILSFSRNDLSLIEAPLSTLGSTSVSDSAAISLEQNLIRTASDEFNLTLALSRRDNHTTLMGQNFSFSDGAVDGWMTSTALRTILDWTSKSDTYVISARSTLSIGLDWLGATNHGGDAPDSHFVSWLGETQQAWRIEPIGSTLLTRVALQLADDRLLAVEQIGLGGADTVRGYRESTLLTDDAAMGSIELRRNLLNMDNFFTLDGAAFVDVGYGWDHGDSHHGTLLAGVGAGLLFTLSQHVEGEVFYGSPLCNRPSGDNLQDMGVYFRLVFKAF